MFSPMSSSKANAIQWPHVLTWWAKLPATVQPRSGISAWKMPKSTLICISTLQTMRRSSIPLTTETAKQSMASAMDNSMVSVRLSIITG